MRCACVLLASVQAQPLLTPLAGVAQVRVRLDGGSTGSTFDDVRLWEE